MRSQTQTVSDPPGIEHTAVGSGHEGGRIFPLGSTQESPGCGGARSSGASGSAGTDGEDARGDWAAARWIRRHGPRLTRGRAGKRMGGRLGGMRTATPVAWRHPAPPPIGRAGAQRRRGALHPDAQGGVHPSAPLRNPRGGQSGDRGLHRALQQRLASPAARVHDPGPRPREAQPEGGLMSKPSTCPENRSRYTRSCSGWPIEASGRSARSAGLRGIKRAW